jgi:hypothetical protein
MGRDQQGQDVEYSRAFNRVQYQNAGASSLVGSGLVWTDGAGGVESAELAGVREVRIDGQIIRVELSENQRSSAYVVDLTQWLRFSDVPEAWHVAYKPDNRGFDIAVSDNVGAQVDLSVTQSAFAFKVISKDFVNLRRST